MRIVLLYICVFISGSGHAGAGNYKAGASAAGMGNAALTSQDVWSLFHNPSGIAFMQSAGAGISYEQRFSLKELSLKSLAVAVPVTKTGTIGVSAAYYGFKNYNEQLAGLTYAHRFNEKISAAIKLNYQAFAIGNEYGSTSLLTGEVSMQARVLNNLWLGAHIYNPAQAELTEAPSEKLPSVFSLGAGYIFSDKLKVEAAAEKTADEKALFRGGLSYHPVKQVYLRAGISSNPLSSSFGFGLELSQVTLDFAAGFHQQLGFTPHISLNYLFKRNQE